MVKGAILVGKRRYRLWRIWDPEKPLLLYVLLNPSHADAQTDDRTVSKLIQFSRDWEYGGFYLGNIHSYISSDPKLLVHHLIPNEPLNIFHLKEMAKKSKKIVLGWGNSGKLPQWLKHITTQPYCLGINQNGSPKHPLYLSRKTTLNPFVYSI